MLKKCLGLVLVIGLHGSFAFSAEVAKSLIVYSSIGNKNHDPEFTISASKCENKTTENEIPEFTVPDTCNAGHGRYEGNWSCRMTANCVLKSADKDGQEILNSDGTFQVHCPLPESAGLAAKDAIEGCSKVTIEDCLATGLRFFGSEPGSLWNLEENVNKKMGTVK
jgi:hypothetical protein